jgi:tRNA dimethylallyltransferase
LAAANLSTSRPADSKLVPVICGPTAVGKTAVAMALSSLWDMEVISADSRQIYKTLDIGTAKPTRKERHKLTHHGIDLIRPGERYSAGRFARDAAGWIRDVRQRGKLPVVVGGTGLYIRALADGLFKEPTLDPERRVELERWTGELDDGELVRWAGRLDPGFRGGGRQRAQRAIEVAILTGRALSYWQQAARTGGAIRPWYVVLTVPRPILHQRILRRSREMVQRGVIEEVAAVLSEGLAENAPGLDSIGMREAVAYLQGRLEREAVADTIATSTRQYAKRQETWFRHQVGGAVLTLDATRGPELIAADIARAWTSV